MLMRKSLMIAMLATSASLPVLAESKSDRDACTPDVFRLCSAEVPNASRIVACLNRKSSELSPGCRAVIKGGDRAAAQERHSR